MKIPLDTMQDFVEMLKRQLADINYHPETVESILSKIALLEGCEWHPDWMAHSLQSYGYKIGKIKNTPFLMHRNDQPITDGFGHAVHEIVYMYEIYPRMFEELEELDVFEEEELARLKHQFLRL